MADAVRTVQNSRAHFDRRIQQMPNPLLEHDLDGDDRPDGFFKCRYAPPEIKPPDAGRVALCEYGTCTRIYGPESGRTELRFALRSADDKPRTVMPQLSIARINARYEYTWPRKQDLPAATIGPQWQTYSATLAVGDDVDRIKIEFAASPRGGFYLASPSWRIVE